MDASEFSERVETFHRTAERISGRVESLPAADQVEASVDLMLSDVIASYAIEGEELDRDSVRSSLLAHFGREVEVLGRGRDMDKEETAAGLIVDVRRKWHQPLSHELLGDWQSLAVPDRITSLVLRGAYRNDPGPMRIVSAGWRERIHYEAPPAADVPDEMERFLDWYNNGSDALPGPVRAAVAHVWFEMIHPFDDGNGRVGRAISDHALSRSLNRPTLACLATAIDEDRPSYYAELEAIGRGNLNLRRFADYFTRAVNRAHDISIEEVEFVLGKTRFFDRHLDALNERQVEVVTRMFREGRRGFEGGLSRRNYTAIAKCSPATAARDLVALRAMGAMRSRGKGRSTRYEIKIPRAIDVVNAVGLPPVR